MTLDRSTGLPILPEEEMFFRVRNCSVELRRRLPDIECSRHPIVPLRDGEMRIFKTRDHEVKGWFRTRIVQEEYAILTNRSEFLASEYTDWVDKDSENAYREAQTRNAGWFDTFAWFKVKISREDIPRLAQEALDTYLAAQERAALLGDYPPKRLEVD